MSIATEIAADWEEVSADGTAVTLADASVIYGILTYQDGIDERRPVLEVAQADSAAIAQGARIVIGTQAYRVEGYQPTERGLARLLLRETT